MRFHRYMLVVAVFVLVVVVLAFVSASHRNRIRTLINTAGRDGKPIIVITHGEFPWLTPLRLFSPEHRPIGFGTTFMGASWPKYFSDDGTLILLGSELGGRSGSISQARFPDHRLHPAEERFPQLLDRPMPTSGPPHLSQNLTWKVEFHSNFITLKDLTSGEITNLHPTNEPPWELSDPLAGTDYEAFISPEGEVVFVIQSTEGSGLPDLIWRYDIEEDNWTKLAKANLDRTRGLTVGPDGRYIAVRMQAQGLSQSSYYAFLDGVTGEELASERDVNLPVIGRRWAACITARSSQPGSIILFDMENGWERSTMDLEHRSPYWRQTSSGSIAMYEPPPNGLDGMYENFDWDEAD